MLAIAQVATRNSAARGRERSSQRAPAPEGIAEGPIRAAAGGEGSVPAGEYLCAGCTAVLTVEPCAMCAMALLHSRIGRVIYAIPDAAGGALGSVYRLHVHRQLNHHFEVFRGLCSDEIGGDVAAACRP